MTTPDTKPVTVKILPTAIWIEYDIFGARHVVVQHEGMEAFTFATFNYQYGYTDNASTYSAAMNLARSLGATEPIEQRSRQWAADVDAAQASSVTEPVGGGVVAALRELANVVSIHLGLGTIPGSYGPGLKGMAMSEWIRKALHASLEKSVVALSTHEATQREGGGTVSGAAEAVPVARLKVYMDRHDMGQSLAPNPPYKVAAAHALKIAGDMPLGEYDLFTAPPTPETKMIPDPGCTVCFGQGRYVIGNSGCDSDGNAPLWDDCDCFMPAASAPCPEAVPVAAWLKFDGMKAMPAYEKAAYARQKDWLSKEIVSEYSIPLYRQPPAPKEVGISASEAVPLNAETRDQIASVMLQFGTPEQQEEALRYVSKPAPQPPNANCPIKCNSMEQCSGACDFMEPAPQPAPDMQKIESDALSNARLLHHGKIAQAYRLNHAQGKTEDDFDRLAWQEIAESVRYAVRLTAREVRNPVWPYVLASLPEQPIPAKPLTRQVLINMRSSAKSDPGCADEYWFIIFARAIEQAHGISAAPTQDTQGGGK